MNVTPASVDQVRRGHAGRMVLIDRDAGHVAEDLARIDPGLKVRFAEEGCPPYWVVFHETELSDGSITQHLVLTAKAELTAAGTWSGLDQRVVKRVMEISGAGYDYAAEVERANVRASKERKYEFAERSGEIAERAAHAVRKDLGARYKGRAFIPRTRGG